jgi:hypothetical protein
MMTVGNPALDSPSGASDSAPHDERLSNGYMAEYKALMDDMLQPGMIVERGMLRRTEPYVAQLSNGHLIAFMAPPAAPVEEPQVQCEDCNPMMVMEPHHPISPRKAPHDNLPRAELYVPVVQLDDGQLNYYPDHVPVPAIHDTPPASIENRPEAPGAASDHPGVPVVTPAPSAGRIEINPAVPAVVAAPPSPVVPLQSTTCIWEYQLTTVTSVLTLTTSTCFTIDLKKRTAESTVNMPVPTSPAGRTTSVPEVIIEDDVVLRRQALIKGAGSRVRVLGLIWLGLCLLLGAAMFILA